MAEQMLYRVLREHEGDKSYVTGDTRTADPAVVAHLIPNVLEAIGPAPAENAPRPPRKTKSGGASPSTKAKTAAPARKAAPAKVRKGR